FCALVGIVEDARFASNAERVAHRGELSALVAEATRRWERDALLAALEEAGVPAGPINDVAQAFADPQIVHLQMALMLDRGDGSAPIPGVRTPIRFSDAELKLGRASPVLGE
ncbi:MAG: CoA transferase, partial [Sphingomonadaceae bacterium]